MLHPRSVAVVVLLATTACTSWSGNRPPGEYAGRQLPPKVRVTTTLGTHRFVHAPRIEADSLIGHAGDSTNIPVRRPNTRIAIPLAHVQTISAQRFDAGRSFLFVAGMGGVLFGFLMVAMAGSNVGAL